VGGVLLAYQAFKDLAEGLERIVAAAVAWERVEPFWRAASRPEKLGRPEYEVAKPGSSESPGPPQTAPSKGSRAEDEGAARAETAAATAAVSSVSQERLPSAAPSFSKAPATVRLRAHDLFFGYRDRAQPVLRGLSLDVRAGDQILLEGPSGGGKSTLGMLLAGSLAPDSGLLLLDGLDLETLGAAGWRRRVIIVPQFHENHVLLGTFAFNLLMGRGWPPRPEDIQEAEKVCRALGLGPLLDRMPGGLLQPVGETGWQLSHGERSRLYIARAILQEGDITILDESFGALDPKTLRRTLGYVLGELPTMVAIAHP
jgi:ATP-binding cassette subfamily B protein